MANIAGICNRERNVAGLMPHPERAVESALDSDDGLVIFRSMVETFMTRRRPLLELVVREMDLFRITGTVCRAPHSFWHVISR